jgi:hypothetical protein
MAVTLPPAASLFLLVVGLNSKPKSNDNQDNLGAKGEPGERPSNVKRAIQSALCAWPLWLTVFAYLALRTLVLGTVTGGYSGSIGADFNHSLWARFFGDGSLKRILYPFNAEVFSDRDGLRRTFTLLYAATGLGVLLRLTALKERTSLTRLSCFAFGWFLLALAPTYQVFNIAPSLQCSRFVYMGTAPLCFLLAVLLLPQPQSNKPLVSRLSSCVGTILGLLFVACGIIVTERNNLPFVHAADQVRTFRTQVERTLHNLPAKEKLVILNVPERLQGAHMIYNDAMLGVLLTPPLSPERLIDRVISFEPPMWGEPDMLNVARLRQLSLRLDEIQFGLAPFTSAVYSSSVYGSGPEQTAPRSIVERVDDASSVIQSHGLPMVFAAPLRNIQKPSAGARASNTAAPATTILSPSLNVSALNVDFVDVTCLAGQNASKNSAFIVLSWKNRQQCSFPSDQKLVLPVTADGRLHKYRFNVSEHKVWVMSGVIDRIALDFPFAAGAPDQTRSRQRMSARVATGSSNSVAPSASAGIPLFELDSIALRSGISEVPTVGCVGVNWQEGNGGIWYPINRKMLFSYDARQVIGATAVRIEVSPPDTWFEHFTGTVSDLSFSEKALKVKLVNSTVGVFALDTADYPSDGFYELRVFAVGADGKIRGCASDPINLQLQVPQTHGR